MALIVNIPPRIDRDALLARADLAAIITADRGAPSRGRKWLCPFHDDHNPSLGLRSGGRRFRCWSCGAKGNALDWYMLRDGLSFIEAAARIDPSITPAPGKAPTRPPARSAPSGGRCANPTATRPARGEPDGPPKMLARDQAAALVAAAAARLWTPEGAEALAYLEGRGLNHETIEAARLGVTGPVAELTGRPRGIVVPWFVGDRLALVKIRQPEGTKPKYREAYRDRDRPPELYPSPATIRPGCPLVLVEGEMDALQLGQALGEQAAVVTLGSAGNGPDPAILGMLLSAPSWFVAHDADEAGDRAAALWTDAYGRARRVRPPAPFKDWSEAGADAPDSTGTAVDLRRWWSAILAGHEAPPPFSRDDLARWRWGPARDDPEPGIIAR